MSTDEIRQHVVDVFYAQAHANAGEIDFIALKKAVGLALGWSADLDDMDALPENIVRALDTFVVCALIMHCVEAGAQIEDLKELFNAMKQQADERGE